MRRVGLIGYPLSHSLSPQLQQAAFRHYALEARYELWETPPPSLEERLQELRSPQCLGANVTIPYKQAVIPFLDELDQEARIIGAVNTIVNRKGALVGYNTDAPAFLKSLEEEGFEPRGKTVLLLGAGGAARAVAFALVRAGAASILIANRTEQKAWQLASTLRTHGARVEVLALTQKALVPALAHCHLVVQATSLGMKHTPEEGLNPLESLPIPRAVLVYDLVYNPGETPLLRAAREAGARTVGGLAMLVYQGALSFEMWTGREAPVEAMAQAAEEALAGG